MPKLEDTREKVKTTFPSIKNSKVTIRKGLRVGEFQEIYGDVEEPDMNCTLKSFVEMIESWNLKDADGEIAEISMENVKELPLDDVMAVLDEIDFIVGGASMMTEEQS